MIIIITIYLNNNIVKNNNNVNSIVESYILFRYTHEISIREKVFEKKEV